jgi:hypothetical protein
VGVLGLCAGRSRLPSSVDAFPMPFKISAPSGEASVMPDAYLPHSRTCFFHLMCV